MTKRIEIEIESDANVGGLSAGRVPGGTLRVVMYGDTAGIEGDRAGFETLAKALLEMVHSGFPEGHFAHIHLDPDVQMDDDSMPVVVQWLRDRKA